MFSLESMTYGTFVEPFTRILARPQGGDDTNLSMNGLVVALQGMPCDKDVFGQDGSCNEPNRQVNGVMACLHPDDTLATLPTTAQTRDKYNIWDLASLFPGNQTGERRLNCVADARD